LLSGSQSVPPILKVLSQALVERVRAGVSECVELRHVTGGLAETKLTPLKLLLQIAKLFASDFHAIT
jgi:hypothetical protein